MPGDVIDLSKLRPNTRTVKHKGIPITITYNTRTKKWDWNFTITIIGRTHEHDYPHHGTASTINRAIHFAKMRLEKEVA